MARFRELAKASWEYMSGDRSWVLAREHCQTPTFPLCLNPYLLRSGHHSTHKGGGAEEKTKRPNQAPYSFKSLEDEVAMVAKVTADNEMHKKKKNLNIYVQSKSSVTLYPLQYRSKSPTCHCNVISVWYRI